MQEIYRFMNGYNRQVCKIQYNMDSSQLPQFSATQSNFPTHHSNPRPSLNKTHRIFPHKPLQSPSQLSRHSSLPQDTTQPHYSPNQHNLTYPSQEPEHQKRLMSLMREQIQIACNFYKESITVSIKEQAKEINLLRQELKKNQQLLIEKNEEIKTLKQHRSPKKKLSLTSSIPCIPQMTNLNERISILEKQLYSVMEREQKITLQHSSLQNKIQHIEEATMKMMSGKLQQCKKKMEKYILKGEKILQSISFSIQENKTPLNIPSEAFTRINSLFDDFNELRTEYTNYTKKQFQYDNHQLVIIHTELQNMKKTVSYIQRQHENIQHTVNNTSQLKVTGFTRNESGFTRNQSKLFQSDEAQNEISDYEDVNSFDEAQSEEQESIEELDTQNEQRLLEVIHEQNYTMPLHVQIDQTGYLKQHTTGLYLVDSNNDGFSLSQLEVNALVQKGIIIID